MTLELEWLKCFWCSAPISRPHPSMPWIDDYESSSCDYHPYAWDIWEQKLTHKVAPHQVETEVHTIVREAHERKLALRERQPLRAVEDNVVNIAKKARQTSRLAAENFLPRSGTMRRKLHDIIFNAGFDGLTDEELERLVGGKHQTISACRRSLVIDGYVEDSGRTRKNSGGEKCIVWVHKDKAYSEVLFNNV